MCAQPAEEQNKNNEKKPASVRAIHIVPDSVSGSKPLNKFST